MIKNAMIYRLAAWPKTARQLEQALCAEPFVECAATQQKAAGWVPPRGDAHGALVEVVNGQWIARFVIETKAVPSDAVRRKTREAIETVEKSTSRKPGKKEQRDLRDDALIALLPNAFPRRSQVTVWVNPKTRLMVLDAGSQGKADEVITSLVRVAGKGFGVGLLQTVTSPQSAMTNWLLDEEGDATPEDFNLGRQCELKGSGDEPARVRFDHHQLEAARSHVREGKLPTHLALNWQGRVGFTLTQQLQLKKIAFQDDVFDGGSKSNEEDRFDADVALFMGELDSLIADLIDALDGESGATVVTDQAPAPKS